MPTMPNLVGLGVQQAVVTLIEADIIPNDGLVPTNDNPPGTVGIFDPWPVAVKYAPGTPEGVVSAQSPIAGAPVVVTKTLTSGNGYVAPIVLTVNAPALGISSQFTAGGYT